MPRSHRPKAISGCSGIEFSEKPDESALRHEQFHHRKKIRLVFGAPEILHQPTVLQQTVADVVGEESHRWAPSISCEKGWLATSSHEVKWISRPAQKCRRSASGSTPPSS